MESRTCNNCGIQLSLGDSWCERRILPSMFKEDDNCWVPFGCIIAEEEEEI